MNMRKLDSKVVFPVWKNILAVVLAFVSTVAVAQDIVGSWNGVLDAGPAKLNVVFHIKADKTATMDSPDQGAMDIPATVRYLASDSICVEIEALKVVYSGKLAGDGIKGVFSQMGYSFPLDLKRGELALNRPQMPQPPFPYGMKEVTFENNGTDPFSGKQTAAGSARLNGTLTLPQNFRKGMPVVLMVTGSGQQNRDEELMGHKPFLVIADCLARHGVATLRYDDRGVGKSTGDYSKATTYDNMLDALAGIDFLRGTKEFGPVGILGHSEGGCIAAMLAARGKADFIVSLAGPVLPGDSILLRQNRDILLASGILGEKDADKYNVALGRMIDYIRSGNKNRFSTPESVVAMLTLDLNLNDMLKKMLSETYKTMDDPWMTYFLSYNPAADFSKVKCPAMLLFGEKDVQVNAAANAKAAETLVKGDSRLGRNVKIYPGLNHLFQPSASGLPMEYGKIETTVSETVLSDIAQWITGVTK